MLAGCVACSDDAVPAGPCDLGTYGYFVGPNRTVLIAAKDASLEVRARAAEPVFFGCQVDVTTVVIDDPRCDGPATYVRVLREDGFGLSSEDECEERRSALAGSWTVAHLPRTVDYDVDYTELKAISGVVYLSSPSSWEGIVDHAVWFGTDPFTPIGAPIATSEGRFAIADGTVVPDDAKFLVLAARDEHGPLYGFRFAALEDLRGSTVARAVRGDRAFGLATSTATVGEMLVRCRDGALAARLLTRNTVAAEWTALDAQAGCSSRVSVASVGDRFLVAFESDAADGAVHATLVSADGAVMAPTGPISDQGIAVRRIVAVGGGDRFLVVWARTRALYGAFVDPDGVAGGRFFIADTRAPPILRDVAHLDGNFLLTWSNDSLDDANLFASLVDENGTTVAERITLADESGHEYAGGLEAGDGGFLATWRHFEGREERPARVLARRIRQDGTFDGAPIVVTESADGSRDTDVAFDGARFVIAWVGAERPGTFGAGVTTNGEVHDLREIYAASNLDPILGAAAQYGARIVSNGAYTTLMWGDFLRGTMERLILPGGGQ